MGTNWWSIAGLSLDVLGALGVGLIPYFFAYGGPIGLARPWQRVLFTVSWSAIVAGFLLQIVAQFRTAAELSSSASVTALATAIIAVATIIYTIGTLLLWRTTRDVFKLNCLLAWNQATTQPGMPPPPALEDALRRIFPEQFSN